MIIKQANIEDLDALVPLFDAYRIFYKQSSDELSARAFLQERILNKQSTIFIAYNNNKAVGFTQLYPIYSSVSMQAMCILNDLFVSTDARGKGIGEALMDAAKQYAVKNNLKGLSLETGNDNPAQYLYERLGWKKDTDYLHYFWKNEV